MEQVKIAVAGAGLIGKTHIKLVSENAQCQLASIVDPSPGAKEVAEEYGVKVYASLEELFAQDKPDGVILATPNRLHAIQAHECINAGVPAIVEKPVTDSIEDAIELLKHANREEAKMLVGHHRAYSPLLETAKSIIDSGELGKTVSIMGSAMFYKPDYYYNEGEWRKVKGGGPILINMIHEIGNLRHLVGDIVGVQALNSNATREFEVEDTTAISLRFANGTLGSFMLSDASASPRSWEQTSQENKTYATYETEDCYHVAGTNGSLSIPTMQIKSFKEGVTPSWWNAMEERQEPVTREDPLKRQLEHFCALIRGEEQTPKVSIYDGLQNLLVIDAIIKATETEQYVPVQDVTALVN
ncbi:MULTISPECIES: Gfo/Idh/MocA family protein [Vibrio]|jgi:predicted dehydrogenase|uniref:Gfo/Idh/MocA family oxidoreductase n=1 Tax=Vibrio chagasii TaxID=170679 RepID=A0A7Y4DU02_9VIBR|nr:MULTISPECIES: Gfo/Idh/MocA family oxidoreductase [Vibrio]MCG9694258.1 Gfo/Idh/MocA family oxidoreductase [Vibrio sp. Isolate22]NOH35902.1 Gfo/Idh/MocA family oxidoreductase [Vibrio chagasii]NOI37501.1 Gfo/Idh/MocA family oxidoreductase [Vibrio sp. 070316B]CAH6855018.1 Gfo/Idh/MocA family oxidoreductase [Vibrio chagasii]CAH6859780.1 Gfo/Idh/MocA family oxidoreductase [Vibrio chagasii]